jgi:hypothetical protein
MSQTASGSMRHGQGHVNKKSADGIPWWVWVIGKFILLYSSDKADKASVVLPLPENTFFYSGSPAKLFE